MTILTNPYRSIPDADNYIRLNLNASLVDVQTIRLVLMKQGDVQSIWALFIQHLANYARHNNLTLADRESFIKYILDRCTESGFNENSGGRNDRRPTSGIRKIRSGKTN